jgi:hypothetical protein
VHECPETRLEGHKERRVIGIGGQWVRPFITSDQNIRYQQTLLGSTIAVLELSTNDLRRIRAAGAMIQSEVSAIKPGAYRRITIP